MPLMLEQSGVRYATIFLSEKALKRFQTECCSLNAFEPARLESSAEILGELQKARKFGCGLLLVDPPGPEISKENARSPRSVSTGDFRRVRSGYDPYGRPWKRSSPRKGTRKAEVKSELMIAALA